MTGTMPLELVKKLQESGAAFAEQMRRLQDEHRHLGEELAAIRRLTGDYAVSEKASATCRVAVEELADFDRDLRRHIHLENNVLFRHVLAHMLTAAN